MAIRARKSPEDSRHGFDHQIDLCFEPPEKSRATLSRTAQRTRRLVPARLAVSWALHCAQDSDHVQNAPWSQIERNQLSAMYVGPLRRLSEAADRFIGATAEKALPPCRPLEQSAPISWVSTN
jgi:hypothetical protein